MALNKNYVLTRLAEQDFREAKKWSMQRWGSKLTKQYFLTTHDITEKIGQKTSQYHTKEELAGDTGLCIHAVKEHYLVYVPVSDKKIIVVALIRQTRDVPSILKTHTRRIKNEVERIIKNHN